MDSVPSAALAARIASIDAAHRTLPFAAETHAIMLGDTVRLRAFEAAIAEAVPPTAGVVDIGTGTGILAFEAARRTKGPVVGIEVSAAAVEVATCLLEGTGLDNVGFQAGLSFGQWVDHRPEVMICELLGPCGVEEDIVEVAYDFWRRHPSITRSIPNEVEVLAAPVRSRQLVNHYAELLDRFHRASDGGPDIGPADALLDRALCETLIEHPITDAEVAGPPRTLARFRIGADPATVVDAAMDIGADRFDAVHVYFEAQLSASVRLSTALGSPATHWQPRFVKRPPSGRRLRVSYVRAERRFAFAW